MFYTYFHTRNDTGAVFYVGKGKGRRAYDVSRNRHWANIVAKCGHTVHIASKWETEAEAFEHEKFLISCFKQIGTPLCNMTDGGEGSSGRVITDQLRAKFRQFGEANGMYKKVISEETRKRMSEASKKRMNDPIMKARISESSKSRKHTEEARAKIKASWSDPKIKAARTAAIKAGKEAKLAEKSIFQIAEGAIQ